MRIFLVSAVTLLSSACGSVPPRAPLSVDHEPADAQSPSAPASAARPSRTVPDDIVARSAAPFRAQRASDGQAIDQTRLLDELARFDVVCLGELHDAARDHFAQLVITEGLERRARVSGRALGVGFEMFQSPFGAALHAYSIGHLDDAGLIEQTHYEQRWGYPYAYYRPILALGRSYGLPLKALNAPRELTHAIAEKGLAELPTEERRKLPAELNLDDAKHRAAFDKLMAGHPHGAGGESHLDNFYEAQVVWDETMADNAARWVAAHAPARQLVILAGRAHCRRDAIPARIERRQALRVTNVRLSPESDDDSSDFDYTLLFEPDSARPTEPAHLKGPGQATTGSAT